MGAGVYDYVHSAYFSNIYGFPLKNQRNKCRNNKGNSNPLFKLANDREQVTRVLSSPSEQLLGKGLKQQAGLNKRHKKTINGD